jgi:hypothetical protein
MTDRPERGRATTKMRYAAVASAATAILLLSACGNGDDSSTSAGGLSPTTSEAAGSKTLATGEDVELVGGEGSGIGNQQLNINAVEENGKATGEFRITDNVIGVDCADTHTDGLVILGGAVTGGPDFAPGDLVALIIREGDPDSVALRANDTGAASCTGMLKAIPDNLLTNDSNFVDVQDGSDIQTG